MEEDVLSSSSREEAAERLSGSFSGAAKKFTGAPAGPDSHPAAPARPIRHNTRRSKESF